MPSNLFASYRITIVPIVVLQRVESHESYLRVFCSQTNQKCAVYLFSFITLHTSSVYDMSIFVTGSFHYNIYLV